MSSKTHMWGLEFNAGCPKEKKKKKKKLPTENTILEDQVANILKLHHIHLSGIFVLNCLKNMETKLKISINGTEI